MLVYGFALAAITSFYEGHAYAHRAYNKRFDQPWLDTASISSETNTKSTNKTKTIMEELRKTAGAFLGAYTYFFHPMTKIFWLAGAACHNKGTYSLAIVDYLNDATTKGENDLIDLFGGRPESMIPCFYPYMTQNNNYPLGRPDLSELKTGYYFAHSGYLDQYVLKSKEIYNQDAQPPHKVRIKEVGYLDKKQFIMTFEPIGWLDRIKLFFMNNDDKKIIDHLRSLISNSNDSENFTLTISSHASVEAQAAARGFVVKNSKLLSQLSSMEKLNVMEFYNDEGNSRSSQQDPWKSLYAELKNKITYYQMVLGDHQSGRRQDLPDYYPFRMFDTDDCEFLNEIISEIAMDSSKSGTTQNNVTNNIEFHNAKTIISTLQGQVEETTVKTERTKEEINDIRCNLQQVQKISKALRDLEKSIDSSITSTEGALRGSSTGDKGNMRLQLERLRHFRESLKKAKSKVQESLKSKERLIQDPGYRYHKIYTKRPSVTPMRSLKTAFYLGFTEVYRRIWLMFYNIYSADFSKFFDAIDIRAGIRALSQGEGLTHFRVSLLAKVLVVPFNVVWDFILFIISYMNLRHVPFDGLRDDVFCPHHTNLYMTNDMNYAKNPAKNPVWLKKEQNQEVVTEEKQNKPEKAMLFGRGVDFSTYYNQVPRCKPIR